MKRIALILAAAIFSVACQQTPPPAPPPPKPKPKPKYNPPKVYIEPHSIAPVGQPDSYSN